jgi:hypothetical protein
MAQARLADRPADAPAPYFNPFTTQDMTAFSCNRPRRAALRTA